MYLNKLIIMQNLSLNSLCTNFCKKMQPASKTCPISKQKNILLNNNLTSDIFVAQNPVCKSQNQATPNQTIEFSNSIIADHQKQNITIPNDWKFKIKDQITDPDVLLQQLKTLSTPYDTTEIITQRARNLVAGKLEIQGNKKMYGLKHHPIIGEILQDATKEIQKANKRKKIYIVTGNSASGKSTYCRESGLTQENGYFLVDSDEIKKKLPYYNELGNNFVHDVSAHIACAELALAFEQGVDIIFPTTGTGKIAVEMALKNGYSIEFLHCNTPDEECIQRSLKRFKEEKRFIDPNYILENGKNLELIENIAKEYNAKFSIIC